MITLKIMITTMIKKIIRKTIVKIVIIEMTKLLQMMIMVIRYKDYVTYH